MYIYEKYHDMCLHKHAESAKSHLTFKGRSLEIGMYIYVYKDEYVNINEYIRMHAYVNTS